MGKVTPMRSDPLDFVVSEAKDHKLTAVALAGIDSDGNYVLTSAGATPEELLMMSELLREQALSHASD